MSSANTIAGYLREFERLVAKGLDAFAIADIFGFVPVPTICDGAEVVEDEVRYDARQTLRCQQQLIESAVLRALAAEQVAQKRQRPSRTACAHLQLVPSRTGES